ncbi:MAG TPA: MFS transporter [Gemmatimonadaceae bacterium]|jgi:MHS family proline/betaine transporter-like MFS transporter
MQSRRHAAPLGNATSSTTSARAARIAVTAASLGNVLEWFDFAVYGFFAAVIGRNFFPTGDEATEVLASFAAFGVGFLARPLGGIVIGRIGDLKGRRTSLLLTIFLMATGTVLIGVAPTYATIGIAGPIIIVIARLLQGFSAGGEWGGSTAFMVEWSEPGRRGFYGSLQQVGVVSGVLLGSVAGATINTLLTPDQIAGWGWRLPFLFGGLIGPVGLYMRRSIGETPAYREAAPESVKVSAHTIGLTARAAGFTILWTVAFYIYINYMPTFTRTYAGLSGAQSLWSNSIGIAVLLVSIPLMGRLSDRIGRRPLLLTCCAAFVVLPYPMARLFLTAPPFAVIAASQVLFGLVISLYSGAGPSAIAEIFPTRSRSTLMSAGNALATALFGGFAPYIASWLIARTGNPIAWVAYVMSAAVVTGLVILSLKETAHEPLR